MAKKKATKKVTLTPRVAKEVKNSDTEILLLGPPVQKLGVYPKANQATLNFPTDTWGCCSKVKKEMIAVASRCAGHPDKMKLLRATLDELMAHINDKDADETQRRARHAT